MAAAILCTHAVNVLADEYSRLWGRGQYLNDANIFISDEVARGWVHWAVFERTYGPRAIMPLYMLTDYNPHTLIDVQVL